MTSHFQHNGKIRNTSTFLFIFAILLTMAVGSNSASAQYFPTWYYGYPNTVPGSSGSSPEGVAVANVPASSQATELLAVFNDGGTPRMAHSLDGYTYTSDGTLPSTMYCDAVQHAGHCTPAVASFGGIAYISFRNYYNQLEVWTGTLVTPTNSYGNWTLVQTVNAPGGGMATSPQMVGFGTTLFIIYGVQSLLANNGHYIGNALCETTFDGTTWSTSASTLGYLTYAAPTQVGLSALGSTLYMVTQQNNTGRHLYYWSSLDGYNWTGTQNNSLYVDSGLSMVTYNNNLIFATKQNNTQDHIFVFSSPDGSTWYAQQQTPLVHEETTPAITLFQGGIQMLYIDHSANGYFYSSFGS